MNIQIFLKIFRIIHNFLEPNIVTEAYEKKTDAFILTFNNLFTCLTKILALTVKAGNFNKICYIVKYYASFFPGTYYSLSKYGLLFISARFKQIKFSIFTLLLVFISLRILMHLSNPFCLKCP